MTSSEMFVSRWMRLKQEAERVVEAGEVIPSLTAVEAAKDKVELATAQSRADEAVSESFDVASLPPVESIVAETDIRAFLQSRVPWQLTQAALRRAWTSDPAIRDFIGIAESQWDFNDPDAMPGFGPLQEIHRVQATQEARELAETVPELPVSVEEVRLTVDDPPYSTMTQNDQQTLATPLASGHSNRTFTDHRNLEATAIESLAPAEGNDRPRNKRSHGGALPR